MDREKQRLTDPNEKKKKFRRKTEIWSNQDIKSNNLIENKLLEMSSNEIEGKHKEINSWLLNYSFTQLHYNYQEKVLTQLTITCLKLTIKTLEQGVQYVQS